MSVQTSRRTFLQSAVAVTFGFRGLQRLFAGDEKSVGSALDSVAAGYGPLRPDANKILDLPEGFSYHVVSKAGQLMNDGFWVPGKPDGMGAFAGPEGKTILIRNHELLFDKPKEGPYGPDNKLLDKIAPEFTYDRGRGSKPCLGGTTTLLYDTKQKKLERQYLSLAGTQFNCAGGPTPWNTWISCEEDVQRADDKFEKDHGYAFEVPATADGKLVRPVPITAMGRFRREAIAVDPRTGIVYQTEDRPEGLLYRFIPNKPGELTAGGKVQVLCVRDRKSLDTRNWPADAGAPAGPEIPVGTRLAIDWMDIDDLQSPKDDLRTRGFQLGAACFARQEGIWYGRNTIYFACTEGGKIKKGQIWKYTPSAHEGTAKEKQEPAALELFIEPNNPSLIENADNLTVAPWGDLVVCEDGSGEQFVVGVTPSGQTYQLARNAVNDSEFAGAVFSPDGQTLFVNLQNAGLTVAIFGPWERRRA